MSHPWRTGTVESGDESIYYEIVGDDEAPAIMLTHGAGGNHAIWFQQVPALAAAGYRVVTWDCRGFGNSSFESGNHGCDAAVADMVAILDTVGIDRVHLVGQSMGGWWVNAFALAHADRVITLTLTNTPGGLWTDEARAALAKQVRTTGDEEERIGAHPALAPSFGGRDPARAFLYQELNTFHTPPMAAVGAALFGESVEHAALDALGIPILMITGTDDALFAPEFIRENAARIENASFLCIDEAGHSAYFERPEAYNAALLSFWEKHT
jgi:pimeloyl-ACP methyl ester carboxylesterase